MNFKKDHLFIGFPVICLNNLKLGDGLKIKLFHSEYPFYCLSLALGLRRPVRPHHSPLIRS
jgi:hypothetical protein